MTEKKYPRTGKIVCARCNSHVVTGSQVLRVFCSNQECRESEFFWLLEVAMNNEEFDIEVEN